MSVVPSRVHLRLTEVGNVRLYPFQHCKLIQHTIVPARVVPSGLETFLIQVWVSQVAKDIVTTIESNKNDIFERHSATVPPGVVARLLRSLIPEHYWQLGVCRACIGPYVKAQTVLADWIARPKSSLSAHHSCAGTSWARIAKLRRLQCCVPWRGRLCRLPSVLICCICAIRDSKEGCDIGTRSVEVLL